MKVPVGVMQLGPLSVQYIRVVFPLANKTVPVGHQLDSDSVGWTIVSKDKFCHIREDSLSNNRSSVGLVSDTDSVTAVIRLETLGLTERR